VPLAPARSLQGWGIAAAASAMTAGDLPAGARGALSPSRSQLLYLREFMAGPCRGFLGLVRGGLYST